MLQPLLSRRPTEGTKCGRSTCCREMRPLLCKWASDGDRSADPASLLPHLSMMLHHLLIFISLTASAWCLYVYRYVVNSIMPALCCILDVQANGKATICQCQYLHSPTRMISSGGEQVLSHLAGLHDHSLISTPHTVHADVSNKHCLLLPESPYVLVLTAANTWCGLGRPSPCCPADVGVLACCS